MNHIIKQKTMGKKTFCTLNKVIEYTGVFSPFISMGIASCLEYAGGLFASRPSTVNAHQCLLLLVPIFEPFTKYCAYGL